MELSHQELLEFLEEKYIQYHTSRFIGTDPVSIPHQFSRKEDIEISAFLTAAISWGNRKSILKSAEELIRRMDSQPFNFITTASQADVRSFSSFYYRTFNGRDCIFFLNSLRNVYLKYGGLEACFASRQNREMKPAISAFRTIFLKPQHETHVEKHIPDPEKGSSCKRINMFLRWMVRNDSKGVDFGIWKSMDQSLLMCPLDVHTGNVARKLGLLTREQNDWKAVEELTAKLRSFDPADPVKYDFALFGLGIFEKF